MRSIGIDLEPWRKRACSCSTRRAPPSTGWRRTSPLMHNLIEQLSARHGRDRPDDQPSIRRSPRRDEEHADAPDRLSQAEADNQPVYRPDAQRRRPEQTQMGISSLMDTWLLLRDIELSGERNRGLYRAEIPRHGPLQPDPGIYNLRQGH